MNKYVIYIGGAYGGKEENKQLIENTIKELKKNRSTRVHNGIHYNSEDTVLFWVCKFHGEK